MDFDLKYFLQKIEHIDHPIWHDKKDAVIWILYNFINKRLITEFIDKPIETIKIKLKFIKKYMHCSREVVYIEELISKYEKKQITTLNELAELSNKIDHLSATIDELYNQSLKNTDILYFDNNLDEYVEVLDLEQKKDNYQVKNYDIDDETIEIISDLEKTMKLARLSPKELKKLDINDETIEVLKDLEKTLILDKPIKEEDIEVLDYLDKTMHIPKLTKKELKKLDINDETIEVLKDLEKTLILDKPIKEENIEILDYLEKTIKIPKLTKKELKKLEVDDETIEVLDFLDKTRKIPKLKSTDIEKIDLEKLKNIENTVQINRYKITDSIIKKIDRKKRRRKIAFCSVLSVLSIIFLISSYRIVIWYRNNLDLKQEIEAITAEIKVTEFDDKNNVVATVDEYATQTFIDVDFNELAKTNPETVGWIYVPGTNIDYPFVQTNDNKYYLNHSFSQKYNEAGWVFMDYRNKIDVLDFNTIIYAHGRLDKTMFGSLRNTLEENWYKDSNNHYIKMAMRSNNTLWQVFSVYKIDTETYYLQNNFDNSEVHRQFLDKIKDRSIYDFEVEVTTDDKILTLSTCYDNFKKVVVHAKMIKQYNK